MKSHLLGNIILFLAITTCCTFSPFQSNSQYQYQLNDPILEPFKAMYEVDREKFCLTPIDPASIVEIERDNGSRGYDVMLHMYHNNVSRTIAFILENGQYVWIDEQEVHQSGRKYMTADGESNESIIVSYNKRKISGSLIGLSIRFHGDLFRSVFPKADYNLSCKDVKLVIEIWDKQDKGTLIK